MSKLEGVTKEYLNKYKVDDVINRESKMIFILESPHTQEMKYGYPVAGDSGIEMTKFIYGNQFNDAFGKLVSQPQKYNEEYNGLNRFSIMNVVSAPMQKGGLRAYNLTEDDEKIITILEKLRVNYKTKEHRSNDWNRVKKILINDFKRRLLTINKENSRLKYFVSCGKFASNYLNLINDEEGLIKDKDIVSGIPHPSFNQWRHYESMDKLRAVMSDE